MQVSMDKVIEYATKYGISFLTAIAIFIIGKWIAKIASNAAEKAMTKAKVNKTLVSFTKNIFYYAILLFVIVATLSQIGLQTGSLVALIGAAGLAVGLALQGSLANFAAGVMIIIFQPFEVGSIIEAGGASGKVEEIQIFNTILSAPDNKRIIIPNAKITADKITIIQK